MSTDTAIQLALETLSKIVQESEQIINRKDLTSLFCLRAIPFIAEHPLFESIRREWLARREFLNTTAIQADEKAREVYIEAFCEIKKRLEANSKAIEKAVVGHLNLVEQTIAGRAYLTFPFSNALDLLWDKLLP